MQRWEYEQMPAFEHEDQFMEDLALRGRMGWELVSVIWKDPTNELVGILKRPLGEPQSDSSVSNLGEVDLGHKGA